MKSKPQTSSRLKQVSARVGLAKCAPDKHDWEFFDGIANIEVFECRICRLKKFVDLKTGRGSFE
jgi:predicted  nucleic acid-binding Zn ribbon protein